MSDDALELVRLRNNFYRDNYRRVLFSLLLCLLIIASLVALVFWQRTHLPSPKYFATSKDGRITPLYALSQPNLSKAAVLQWASTAAVSAYTYNFVNYRKAFQDTSKYFTPEGWQEFMTKLENSQNLEAMKQKKLVVSAVATGAPVILQEGLVAGRYAWKIQMPLLVTYQSTSQQIQQSLLLTLMVTRTPTLNSPEGIGIAQFAAQAS